jgi:hypothetical protein
MICCNQYEYAKDRQCEKRSPKSMECELYVHYAKLLPCGALNVMKYGLG